MSKHGCWLLHKWVYIGWQPMIERKQGPFDSRTDKERTCSQPTELCADCEKTRTKNRR